MPNNTHFFFFFVGTLRLILEYPKISFSQKNKRIQVNKYSNLLDNGLSLYGCRPLYVGLVSTFKGFNPFNTHLTKTWVLDKTKNKKDYSNLLVKRRKTDPSLFNFSPGN